MNQHAVSTGPGGYLFAFSISRTWLRIAGACAVAAGMVIAVVANAAEPFRAPLGIALGVLAITLLIVIAVKSSALLAELHAKGALSDEEFSAAKLRTLGG